MKAEARKACVAATAFCAAIKIPLEFYFRSNYFPLIGGGKEGLPPEFNMNHNFFNNLKVTSDTTTLRQLTYIMNLKLTVQDLYTYGRAMNPLTFGLFYISFWGNSCTVHMAASWQLSYPSSQSE
jgi:hypothetical protein